MKEMTISASEFKSKCLRLLDKVAEEGLRLVITKRGRPIARVSPTLRGRWKGIVKIKGDIVNFNEADAWTHDFDNL